MTGPVYNLPFLGGIAMRWRRWRQDVRLWLRRRLSTLSEWTSDALARRWVQQTLAALALLVLLSTLHRGERLAFIGSADHWLRETVTQPYDFRAAAQRVQASPVWRAARVPEIVDRLRRSLAVPASQNAPGPATTAGGSSGPAGGQGVPAADQAMPALAQPGAGSTLRDGGETGLAVTLLPPVPGVVVRTFGHAAGTEANNLFQGLELQTQPGTPVHAAAAGTVLSVDSDPAGKRLTLDHGGGLRTRCTFAGQVAVKVGDRVDRGAILGKVDDSDGARVYFEVEVDGRAVDPSPFLPEEPRSV